LSVTVSPAATPIEVSEHMEDHASVGSRLHILRQERDLSQRGLAERAGVSANAISLIERNEISPSVATLQRLAAALSVRMSYFFDGTAEADIVLSRAGTRPKIVSEGVTIEGVRSRLHEQQMEPFYLRLAPKASCGGDYAVHIGQELVFCARGRVEYEVDKTAYLLSAGDFLLFNASLPHCWRNPYDESAELLLVLQAPEPTEDLARRHFIRQPSVAQIG
jgi:transcriptional regulator with XRE-family HTH domain